MATTPSTTIRVSKATRERLMRVRADDFQGASIEDMLGRLLDEHAEQALRARLRADAEHARSNDEDLDEVRLVLEELDELSAW